MYLQKWKPRKAGDAPDSMVAPHGLPSIHMVLLASVLLHVHPTKVLFVGRGA